MLYLANISNKDMPVTKFRLSEAKRKLSVRSAAIVIASSCGKLTSNWLGEYAVCFIVGDYHHYSYIKLTEKMTHEMWSESFHKNLSSVNISLDEFKKSMEEGF